MRALLTVNNKKGIVEFAKKLEQLNVEIVSAGATYEMLKDSGISVADVSTMISVSYTHLTLPTTERV